MASTAKYYRQNREARLRRLKQQRKYNKTKKGLALRVNANRLNRQLGTYGNGDGRDAAHYKGSTTKGRLQSPADSKVHPKTGKADLKYVNDPSTT
jgi:hypothetical protein